MSEEKYIHEQHTVHHILYHIIFCAKRRGKVLVGPVHARLKQIIEQVAEEQQWESVRLAIEPDHVHLFIQTNLYTLPTVSHGSSRDALLIICEKRSPT